MIAEFILLPVVAAGAGYCAVLGGGVVVRRLSDRFSSTVRTRVEEASGDPLVDRVVELLETKPAEWSVGDHTLDHAPTRLRIWICNGVENVCFYSVGGGNSGQLEDLRKSLTPSSKRRLWNAFKALKGATDTTERAKHRSKVKSALDAYDAAQVSA